VIGLTVVVVAFSRVVVNEVSVKEVVEAAEFLVVVVGTAHTLESQI